MGARKPKEFSKIPIKKITDVHLKEIISEALLRPTSEIVDILAASEEEIDISIIEMAVFRCAWMGYMDGDVKRLEWLLNKVGIKDAAENNESQLDLSSMTSDTILKALNIKGDTKGEGKKTGKSQKK